MITWKIENLEHHTSNGGVITAHWRVNTQEDNFYASSYGSAGFTPDPEATDFIPYENLTEEIVLGWLKSQLGEEAVTNLEESLQNQINDQKAPKVASGLPWIQPLVTEEVSDA